MRLLIKQRVFSWSDTYDVYDEEGNVRYFVRAEVFALGHQIHVYDAAHVEVGMIRQKLFNLLPVFEIETGGIKRGQIEKQFTLFQPKYDIDFNGWQVEGNWLEWDYTILRSDGGVVATISKELLHMTDTYVLDIQNPKDALHVLMFVLAMDAEKCSRN